VRRPLLLLWSLLSSRILPPLVIGFFLLVYIGIAFGTNDTLMALMEVTRSSLLLTAILALLPLNSACRVVVETRRYLERRRVMKAGAAQLPPGLFDETVEVPGSRALAGLESRLGDAGYQTRHGGGALSARRGISTFAARVLYLVATFCLFAGILISLTSRTSLRAAIIEGETLPDTVGGGKVEKISLGKPTGSILAKNLAMVVAPSSDSGQGVRVFGLYPPSFYQGAFVYPRYLGIGVFARFTAPDLPQGYEEHYILSIHPPGKEDSKEIPRSAYRIVFSLAEPADGSDPYVTGHMTFLFKVLKGKEVLFSGSAPSGGEFVHDGYRLSFPDSRRLVITDFISDNGVFLIWFAALLYLVAGCIWLPVRLLFPCREMLFQNNPDGMQASSRAEGRGRSHAEVFHEALDFLEKRAESSGL
jgi:hypothetical protein